MSPKFDNLLTLMVENYISLSPMPGKHILSGTGSERFIEDRCGELIERSMDWFTKSDYSDFETVADDILCDFNELYEEYLEKKGIRYSIEDVSEDDLMAARDTFITVVENYICYTRDGKSLYSALTKFVDDAMINLADGRPLGSRVSKEEQGLYRSAPGYKTISYREVASLVTTVAVVIASDKRHRDLTGLWLMKLIAKLCRLSAETATIVGPLYLDRILD